MLVHIYSRRTFQENLDWADLVTIDLSLYDTHEGRKQLAQTLVKAVREDGFFYVKNFNISQERVNRQFSIGKRLYDIPLEEKLKYVPEGLGQLLHHGALGCSSRLILERANGRQRSVQWLCARGTKNVRLCRQSLP